MERKTDRMKEAIKRWRKCHLGSSYKVARRRLEEWGKLREVCAQVCVCVCACMCAEKCVALKHWCMLMDACECGRERKRMRARWRSKLSPFYPKAQLCVWGKVRECVNACWLRCVCVCACECVCLREKVRKRKRKRERERERDAWIFPHPTANSATFSV